MSCSTCKETGIIWVLISGLFLAGSPFALVEEGGDVFRSLLDEVVVDEELDAFLGIHVELFLAHLEVSDFGSATHDPLGKFPQ